MRHISQSYQQNDLQSRANAKVIDAGEYASVVMTNLTLTAIMTGVFGLTIATILQRLIGLM